MTPLDKLAWMHQRCNSVSLEFNQHRSYYETVEQAIANETHGYRDTFPDDAVRDECIKRDSVVVVQAYPDTPIGFLLIAHYDAEGAIDAMYEALVKVFPS